MTFFCRLDGAPAVQCASPLIQDNLAEGRHFFEVRATTDAGVEETVPAQWSWEVDLTGPITTINSETPQLTNQRTQIFEFVSEETEATFECSLNETEWVGCTSPWSVEGIEGENIWRVRAVDTLGNLEADPNFVSWTLDTQPPTSTWVEQPPSYSGMRTVSFEVSSDETITSYECELDTEAFPCDTTFEVQDLSHGTHAVQLWATDLAGNRQGAALVAEWQTDIEAAVTTVLEAPPAYTNTDVAVFQFEMSEPADLFCGLDELPYETCDPTVTLGGLAPGAHQLAFYTEDNAGNSSTVETIVWSIDFTPPTSQWLNTPQALTNQTQATLEFEADEPVTFFCMLDEQDPQPCESPWTVAMLEDGNHVVSTYAVDRAGNIETTPLSFGWTVDTQPPDISWSGPVEITNLQNATFVGTHSDVVQFECYLDDEESETCSDNFELQMLTEGLQFRVRGRDEAGNWSAFTEISWTIDLTAPILSVTRVPDAYISEQDVVIEFASESTAMFYCGLDDADFVPCESPWHTDQLVNGSHTALIYAQDVAGNNSETVQLSWVVDTQAPTLNFTQTPDALQHGDTVVFAVEAIDATPLSYECALQDAAWSDCVPPVEYEDLEETNYTFSIRARDSANNVSGVLGYSWEQNNRPETLITNPISGTVSTTSATFYFSSNEADVTFQCQKGDEAFFDCVSPYTWESLTNGQYVFRVVATDNRGRSI